MNLLKIWRQAWRIAELRLLFLALVISVTAVTSLKLAQVKAVTPNFPLRGSVETNTTLQRDGNKDSLDNLGSGQVWAQQAC